MPTQSNQVKGCSVKAYQGDAKTLLAFNLKDRKSATNLAGFTIQAQPGAEAPYFLHNTLRFETPGDHTQVAVEPAASSINAPFHKFRWLHVPGLIHQGRKPFMGSYTYTVTPRFFEAGSLQPIDPSRGVAVTIDVVPFQKQGVELGFARGFTQSQAFVHHFGLKALIRPRTKGLQFDTAQKSGVDSTGQPYTFQDEYEWMGYTARAKIFGILQEAVNDKSLHVDVFAYDLNEPDVCGLMLQLAGDGRIRIILDDAALHHSASAPKPEDEFEKLFNKKAAAKAEIKRGHFRRFAHDKIFIVSNKSGPTKVMSGSTNFSVTGMYVNSNHVVVFNDPKVAAKYQEVFEEAWSGDVKIGFNKSNLASDTFSWASKQTPQVEITFSPHPPTIAEKILNGIVQRIKAEGKKPGGSVLFAVMQLDSGTGPVFPALQALHESQDIFSFGISDSTKGIALYELGSKKGVLVTGKPGKSQLPPPFDQIPGVGLGHQVHHKFVVCGFNSKDAVTYLGSSNLAQGGEEANGDNLIAIHDSDVATAFAIEALGLVDHFQFLDSVADKSKDLKPTSASKLQAATSAGWFLSTTDKWVDPYFDPDDLHCMDRQLFGA